MKNRVFGSLVALVIFATAQGGYAEPADGMALQRALYRSLALDPDPVKSRWGLRSIPQLDDGAEKIELCDLVAERLIRFANADPILPGDFADLVGWHVNVLAECGDGRYRDILQEARTLYSYPKLLLRIDNALKAIASTQTPQYSSRRFDLAAIRAATAQTLAANRKTDRTAFAKIQPGAKVHDVLSALGSPDDVSVINIRIAKWGRSSLLTIHYAGHGFVILNPSRAEARQLVALELVEELVPLKDNYDGAKLGLVQIATSLRSLALFEFYRLHRNGLAKDAAVARMLGRRVLEVPPADKYERTTMIGYVRFVARMPIDEALELLQQIEASAADDRVKKEAAAYVRKLQANKLKGTPLPPEPEETETDSGQEASNDEEP